MSFNASFWVHKAGYSPDYWSLARLNDTSLFKTATNFKTIHKSRQAAGNMLIWLGAITLTLILAVVFFTLNYTRFLGGSREQATAIEAAALAAASDLSKIIYNDPHYGFVAISDFPPIGDATTAGDNQPLPVLGINTIIGTARLNMLVAAELNDPTLITLAGNDAEHARTTANALSNALNAALVPGGNGARDFDGNAVSPYDDALAVYKANGMKMSGATQEPVNFKLTLGWLRDGTTTTTALPQPTGQAQVSGNQQEGGNYKGFINIPAGNKDFYFVGASNQPTLVDNSRFQPIDGSRPCSIVKVEADQDIVETTQDGGPRHHTLHAVACAQPWANIDKITAGTIAIDFPSGGVPGIDNPGDIVTNPELNTNPSKLFSPEDGDWPGDGQLMPAAFEGGTGDPSVAQTWSLGLYHWMRNARTKARIDDLKDMQTKDFDSFGTPGTMTQLSNLPDKPTRRFNTDIIPRAYATTFSDDLVLSGLMIQPSLASRLATFTSSSPAAVQAYLGMADYVDIQRLLPANAFVIGQTRDGSICSADRHPLQIETVHEFWMRLTETNTAALVALAMGRSIVAELVGPISNQTAKLAALNAEVAEKHQRLENPSITVDQKMQIEKELEGPMREVAERSRELQGLRDSMQRAQNAIAKGTSIATITDLIAKNQRFLSSRGFRKEGENFIIGGSPFIPHTTPPTNMEAIRNGTDQWASETDHMECYHMPSAVLRRPQNHSWLPIAKAKPPRVLPAAITKMYIYELNEKGRIVATMLPLSPYQDIPVSHNQLFGLSFDAMTTKKGGLNLTWSASMRDQTAVLGMKKGGKHAGQPIGGSPINWCEDVRFGQGRKKRLIQLDIAPDSVQTGIPFRPGEPQLTPSTTVPLTHLDCLCQPAFAQSGGSFGGPGPGGGSFGGPGPGKPKKRQPRNTYLCGGLATEFQIRSPMVLNLGFEPGTPQLLRVGRRSVLAGHTPQGEQPGVHNVQGAPGPLMIPDTPNWVIRQFPDPLPFIPSTMAPGAGSPTSLCPLIPNSLL